MGIYFAVFQDGRNSSQDTKFARTINREQNSDLALLRFPLSFSQEFHGYLMFSSSSRSLISMCKKPVPFWILFGKAHLQNKSIFLIFQIFIKEQDINCIILVRHELYLAFRSMFQCFSFHQLRSARALENATFKYSLCFITFEFSKVVNGTPAHLE